MPPFPVPINSLLLFLLAFQCWLLGWPLVGQHMQFTLPGAPHVCRCEDRELVMSFWFLLCPLSWLSILGRATWWLLSLSLTQLARFPSQWLFAFGSFKEHQHHHPGVYQMQVRGCLLCMYYVPISKGLLEENHREMNCKCILSSSYGELRSHSIVSLPRSKRIS